MPLKETEVYRFKPSGDLSRSDKVLLSEHAKELGATIDKTKEYISSSSGYAKPIFMPAGTKLYAITSMDQESGEGVKDSRSAYFMDEKAFRQLEDTGAIDIERNMIDRHLVSDMLSLPAYNKMDCLVAITTTKDQHFIAAGVAPAVQLYQHADWELCNHNFTSIECERATQGGGRQVFCLPGHATDRPMPTPANPDPKTIPVATEVGGIAQIYDLTDWRQPKMDWSPEMFTNEKASLFSHADAQDVLESYFEREPHKPTAISPRSNSRLSDNWGHAPAPPSSPALSPAAPSAPRAASLRR